MVQYYARVDNSIVTDINVIADAVVEDGGELAGSSLLTDLFGGTWVRFSKTGEFRYNKPASGYIYDNERDAFIAPQPFDSWSLNEENLKWEPPVPAPNDNYYWDEDSLSWKVIELV